MDNPIGEAPRNNYTGSVPAQGAAMDVDYPSDILWDDNSQILWDDLTVISWSNTVSTNPDANFSSSVPRTSYTGQAE